MEMPRPDRNSGWNGSQETKMKNLKFLKIIAVIAAVILNAVIPSGFAQVAAVPVETIDQRLSEIEQEVQVLKRLKEVEQEVNLKKEKPGMKINEFFWKDVDDVILTASSYAKSVEEIAEKLKPRMPYIKKLKQSLKIWSRLF